jgi:hypothetical protein
MTAPCRAREAHVLSLRSASRFAVASGIAVRDCPSTNLDGPLARGRPIGPENEIRGTRFSVGHLATRGIALR